MFKAIAYKEWLKIRWFVIGGAAVSLLWIILTVLLDVYSQMKFTEAISYWYVVVFRGVQFYSSYMYIPMLLGFTLAAAQFIPETTDKRIKLTFHLPMDENSVLLQMLSIGLISLISIFVVSAILLVITSLIFFPTDVVPSMVITLAPWFLGGLVTYMGAAAVILEPNWVHRIISGLVGIGFLFLLYNNHWYGIYQRCLLTFTLLGLCFALSLLLSGYRFRKGVA